jgi:hypothetical protein
VTRLLFVRFRHIASRRCEPADTTYPAAHGW